MMLKCQPENLHPILSKDLGQSKLQKKGMVKSHTSKLIQMRRTPRLGG